MNSVTREWVSITHGNLCVAYARKVGFDGLIFQRVLA